MQQVLEFDPILIQRYDISGPRYTSYPTAVQFTESFTADDYRRIAQDSSADPEKPLSLYFHIPFCDTVCFYCGCNKVITKNRAHTIPYLNALYREIAIQGALYPKSRPVTQLHWGGGTPTFISHEQMTELMQQTREHFNLLEDDSGEYSIEVDPREASAETIALLRKLGFNRLSMGVQDFDPDVQRAVNRIQTEEETREIMDAARSQGFKSVSLDLIYGLPHQSVESFGKTLDRVIDMAPDRFSVFNYAHLPELFKMQRRIHAVDLPLPEEKLRILGMTIERLHEAGYIYIGMDHFARPDDELAIAQREGSLYRNFQGYSTRANCDLVAMGATSISRVGPSYSQNVKEVDQYESILETDHLPVLRGIELNEDDLIRQDIISRLMCHFSLDIQALSSTHQIDFGHYFKKEIQQLERFADDGLIEMDMQHLNVLPRGRLLIRNLCMVFDRYLTQQSSQKFSKVI
ncbi:MAG: oxygen-independent coproporphyrinogen III oxidase [Gammaproteobacteria bacterium]|nr:MAG: oxygen-independent coproporphyrinogen III oxidase [Gammaproteobacteria bacterium]